MRNSYKNFPDDKGHFESFGGRYVAETLMPLILDLEKAYEESKKDPSFKSKMNSLLKDYVGRPSPLYFAERLTSYLKGSLFIIVIRVFKFTFLLNVYNSLSIVDIQFLYHSSPLSM